MMRKKEKSAIRSMPIDASMAMRLHEAGREEEQVRLVYALCVCLDRKERWLATGFKKPKDLKRWALAGTERWGLAPEFEPMRRWSRSLEWDALALTAHGRFNEVIKNRLSNMGALFYSAPRLDHVYWLMVFVALGFMSWGVQELGAWVGQVKGVWAVAGIWGFGVAILAICLKSAEYIWQDSSGGIGEGIKTWVWGRSPQEDAQKAMAWLDAGSKQLAEGGEASGTLAALRVKARSGTLGPLEALEISKYQKKKKSLCEDWFAAQDKMEESGKSMIEQSKQDGWAMACLERATLGEESLGAPEEKPAKKSQSL